MENTPATADAKAPVEAPASTENAAPAAPAPAETAPANTINLTDDQIKWIQANGGFDKIKETVTRRNADIKAAETKAPEAPQQPEAPKTETPSAPAQQAPQSVPEGYVTPQEVAVRQYFNNLAAEEAYKGIAEDIRTGEVFKEMAKLGINATNEQGYINDAKVRAYLDIKAQTVVAKQEANVLAAKSAAPTVEYIGGENANITSFKEASDILAQSRELKAKGLAPNPNEKAAIEYIAKTTGGNLDALKK